LSLILRKLLGAGTPRDLKNRAGQVFSRLLRSLSCWMAGTVSASRKNNYRLVMIGARGIRPRPATDADVTEGNTPEPGTKALPLTLSKSALQGGYDLLYQDPMISFDREIGILSPQVVGGPQSLVGGGAPLLN
jgi:hypothetical protein